MISLKFHSFGEGESAADHENNAHIYSMTNILEKSLLFCKS